MNSKLNNKLLDNLNIKKKEQGGGSKKKLSPMSEKYRLYLQQGGNKSKGSFLEKSKDVRSLNKKA